MNYIVFDLEWNQAASKAEENPKLAREIIEVGAVKVSENGKIIDHFSAVVKPQVYLKLFYRTKELVGITDRELFQGKSFAKVMRRFFTWCGQNVMFCSWGSQDLTELQRNMKYFHVNYGFPQPLYFYDVQKLFALEKAEGSRRRTLESAVEELNLPLERPFHRALDDAEYTAQVFIRLNGEVLKKYVSVDYYQIPQSIQEEIYLNFGGYSKYVSREYLNRDQLMENRKVTATPCIFCGKSMKKKLRWFSDGGKNFYCLADCPEHGRMKGKIRVKKAEDGIGVFAVRTIRKCTEEEQQRLFSKRDALRVKRRRRRTREEQNQKKET